MAQKSTLFVLQGTFFEAGSNTYHSCSKLLKSSQAFCIILNMEQFNICSNATEVCFLGSGRNRFPSTRNNNNILLAYGSKSYPRPSTLL